MKNVISLQPFYLAQPLGATDVTMQVRGLKDSRGNLITAMPSGVTELTITIEPRSTTNQEFVSGTGITDNGNGLVTITGLTRNLSPVDGSADLSDTVSHANNSECVVSNSPFSMRNVLTTDEDKTVTATISFGASPTVPTGVNPTDAVNKSQLDATIAGTIPASSTTVLGAVRVATNATKTLGTATMTIASPCVVTFNSHGLTANDTVRFTTTIALPTGIVAGTTYYVIATGLTANTFQLSLTAGGTAVVTTGTQSGVHTLYRTTPYAVNDMDYRFGENSFGVDSGTANAHVVTLPRSQPTAYVSGLKFSYLVNVSNTSAVTSNIAGLGAKTIKKLDGVTDLVLGDLIAGQLIELEYNATSGFLMLLSPVATAPVTYLGYGDGSDGSGTLDGVSTVFGLVPAGNVYTMTRDMYFIDLTINTGVTLNPNGYRVFGTGTLTGVGTGKIARNGLTGATGGNGSGAGNGSPGPGGTNGGATSGLSAGSISGSLGGSAGGNGGTGSNGTVAGTAGSAGTSASTLANSVGSGSPSASGGVASGSSNTAGGGTVAGVASNTVTNPPMMPRTAEWAMLLHYFSGATVGYMAGSNLATGGSGGAGGGAITGGNGGGGGAGGSGGGCGGLVCVAFKTIVSPANNFIQALGGTGGTGGNGGTAGAGVNGAGGSGGTGGTGGVVCVVYKTMTGTIITTASVAGGTGGTAGTGFASGNAGTAGNAGKLYLVNM